MLTPHNSETIDQDRRQLPGLRRNGGGHCRNNQSVSYGYSSRRSGFRDPPLQRQISGESLLDLRRRINATRWPDRETVSDQSQGIQLAKLQPLMRYWGTEYDWRKIEAKMNALPQFVTEIDGIDIHFIHVRSKHPNALPVIITHGWPGSVFEQLKVIGPLTDPTAHGGRLRMHSMS